MRLHTLGQLSSQDLQQLRDGLEAQPNGIDKVLLLDRLETGDVDTLSSKEWRAILKALGQPQSNVIDRLVGDIFI